MRADIRIYDLCNASTSHSGQCDNLLLVKKKVMLVFSCVCPVIDNEFRNDMVKVVRESQVLTVLAVKLHTILMKKEKI